jgi:hypothetical protein
MEKSALKEITYGGVQELARNTKYFRYSAVGLTYSHWTEEGQQALMDFMNMVAHKMHEAEEEELRYKAKQITIEGLKGKSI